ncbi:MAG: hypothetical protein OXH24_10250 [Cyanobacteria bacterium MAG IRC3_bin_20]|nr:hypothetical protein [Cyanobacteria bacterium MAG IRC3_bin_20]
MLPTCSKDLLALDPRKPRQAKASLKRVISTAYYALFSLLVDEVAGAVVGGGSGRKRLRGYVIRTFSHRSMADVCRGFARRNPSRKNLEVLAGREISDDLASIADTFCNLQNERSEADYNFVRSYTKEQAQIIIDYTEIVHQK